MKIHIVTRVVSAIVVAYAAVMAIQALMGTGSTNTVPPNAVTVNNTCWIWLLPEEHTNTHPDPGLSL